MFRLGCVRALDVAEGRVRFYDPGRNEIIQLDHVSKADFKRLDNGVLQVDTCRAQDGPSIVCTRAGCRSSW